VTDADVIIIGAGHNGLVAGTYLARAGLRVSVFECRPFVGGAAITEELWPGCFFSTCAHMIHAVHPRLIRDLRLYERGLDVIPRTFSLHLRSDGRYYGPAEHASGHNLSSPDNLTPSERSADARYSAFKASLRSLFAPYRLRTPPSLDEVRTRVEGTAAEAVLEQAVEKRVSDLHDGFLPSDVLKERYAAEVASIGRDPLALSLAYASIDEPDEETGEQPPHGYVRGGLGNLSKLLAQAAVDAGAKIFVGHRVERIITEGSTIVGIRLADGTEVRTGLVVSNLDPKQTFLRLIDRGALSPKFRERVGGLTTHISCLKLLAVISELPEWPAWDGDPHLPSTGLVSLTRSRRDVAAAYDDLDTRQPPRAPVVNFSVPSMVDASLAPAGYHTASIWIYPAPAQLDEGSWDDVREQVAERLIDQITADAPNFRRAIRHYKLRTPLDIERENGITNGCIWHVQHTGDALFWGRPLPELAAYRAPLPGLYLCGAGQHPGGEVSGIPGYNAAQEVLKDLDQRRLR
jgi:phytoene dehydrogenase-like protein